VFPCVPLHFNHCVYGYTVQRAIVELRFKSGDYDDLAFMSLCWAPTRCATSSRSLAKSTVQMAHVTFRPVLADDEWMPGLCSCAWWRISALLVEKRCTQTGHTNAVSDACR